MLSRLRDFFLSFSPVQNFIVRGESMRPTLLPGQKVLVNRLNYIFLKPKIGDIVVVKSPEDGRMVIKRIDKVEDGKYFVVGDNLKKSTDSRVFGAVSKSAIIGKVIHT